MKELAIIGCLSQCKRGLPLTATRPYAEIPIINKRIIDHQLAALEEFEVAIIVNGHAEMLNEIYRDNAITLINKEDEARVKELVEKASLLIPGDLLFSEVVGTGKRALLTTKKGSEEEDALKELLEQLGIEAQPLEVEASRINYPWEILDANQAMIKGIKAEIDPSVVIEEHVTITGEVIIGEGTIIRSGSYIEGPAIIGPNCEIGPQCHIRPETSIGPNCRIGKTEVVDAVIMRNTTSKHHAYLGHSVLGEEVNIGAFTVTADYRHDGQEHIVLVNGEKLPSGRRKVGAFLGDHVRTAITTSIYPGRKIGPHGLTLPGEVVKKDKE